MRLFEEEIKIKEKFDKMNLTELETYFKSLDFNIQLDILIKWFGCNSLFNEMILKETGIIHLKEYLQIIEKEGLKE